MNTNQRTKYLKNVWNKKNQDILKEIPDFFQDYFEYWDGFIKKNNSNVPYTVGLLHKSYRMIKFLVKYNILNTFQFLSMMQIFLNESLLETDIKEIKKSNILY